MTRSDHVRLLLPPVSPHTHTAVHNTPCSAQAHGAEGSKERALSGVHPHPEKKDVHTTAIAPPTTWKKQGPEGRPAQGSLDTRGAATLPATIASPWRRPSSHQHPHTPTSHRPGDARVPPSVARAQQTLNIAFITRTSTNRKAETGKPHNLQSH